MCNGRKQKRQSSALWTSGKAGHWPGLPEGRVALRYKWIYTKKISAYNELEGLKVRLSINGARQIHGVDFTESNAPTVRPETARLAIMVARHFTLVCRQTDCVTAFFTEEVYMLIPEEYNVDEAARQQGFNVSQPQGSGRLVL